MIKLSSWLDITLIVSLAGLGLCGVARGNVNDDSQIPKKLQVPTEQRILLKAAGRGSQIYVCDRLPDNQSLFE